MTANSIPSYKSVSVNHVLRIHRRFFVTVRAIISGTNRFKFQIFMAAVQIFREVSDRFAYLLGFIRVLFMNTPYNNYTIFR